MVAANSRAMPERTFEEYQRDKREREWNDKVKKQKEAMGNQERVDRSKKWKEIGNDKFKAGNVFEAKDYYREAIIYVEDLVDARKKERNELLVPLYSNLAMCYLKLGENDKVEEITSKAVLITENPKNGFHVSHHAKAQFRRGLGRRRTGNIEGARDDFAAVLKLDPTQEEAKKHFDEVKEQLAAEAKKAREAMGGFFNKAKDKEEQNEELRRQKEEKRKRQEEARKKAEERRAERKAKAEQRQQMQTAFQKLSEGEMLYAKREVEMIPVREKEKEKEKTLELEKDLLNIIEESKGNDTSKNMEEFMVKKEKQAVEQNDELDQKKKVLDKLDKEKKWDEDDEWRERQDDRHKKKKDELEKGLAPQGPIESSKELVVARWVEQHLRDRLVGVCIEGHKLEPKMAAAVLGEKEVNCKDFILKGIVTDALKIEGDASVIKLAAHKPPIHYFEYFIKLDWEVSVSHIEDHSYRTAQELIKEAAYTENNNAPKSVTKNNVTRGTFKIKEFSSEDEPEEGQWTFKTKVKHECEYGQKLAVLAGEIRDKLKAATERRINRFHDEYKERWPV